MDLRLCVVKSRLLAFLVGALSSGVCINCMPNLLRLVLNQTLGTVVGVHTKHTGVCFPVLYTELSIPSVESLIEGRRTRVWAKRPSMRP